MYEIRAGYIESMAMYVCFLKDQKVLEAAMSRQQAAQGDPNVTLKEVLRVKSKLGCISLLR